MTIWLEILLVIVLVFANAAFAGTEMALVSLNSGQLQRLEKRGRAGRAVGDLVRDPNTFLATIQIGITFAGFLASATAAVSLAEPVVGWLGFSGEAAEPVAVVLVTIVLSFFTLVIGELAPKRIAMQRAEQWALLAALPLSALARLSRPAIWLLAHATNATVRFLGADPTLHREEVTGDDVRAMAESHIDFTPQQRRIIAGPIEVAQRRLGEIVTPRRDVVAVHAATPVAAALAELAESGHSRAPVIGDDLDEVLGIVHLRDLVASGATAQDRARPCLFLPETVGVLDAFRQIQAEREQLAVVVNEHGGVEGIVTVEDLVEELVGEIYDETDRDLGSVTRADDGTLGLPGSFPVHDLVDIGVEVPAGDYVTVAGLILDRLGHIPEAGETMTIGQWRMTVTTVVDRAIVGVELTHHEADSPEGIRDDS